MARKLFLFFIIITVAISPVALAQQQVQKGDTLWGLAGKHLGNPTIWRQVVEKNPVLKEKGRTFSKGDKIVVLLRPGERLEGLGELGIIPDPLPLSMLTVAPPPAPTHQRAENFTGVSEESNSEPIPRTSPFENRWVLGTLLALFGTALAFFLFYEMRRSRNARRLAANPRDPELQGPPMRREGFRYALGIPPTVAENLATATRLSGGKRPTEIVQLNLAAVRGVITEYWNGQRYSLPTGQVTYVAIFRGKKGLIKNVTFHFRACQNGMLFGEMTAEAVRKFFEGAALQNMKRIWCAPEWTQTFNAAELETWIREKFPEKLARRHEREAAAAADEATPATPPAIHVVETDETPSAPRGTGVSITRAGNAWLVRVGGREVRASGHIEMDEESITIGNGEGVITIALAPAVAAMPRVAAVHN